MLTSPDRSRVWAWPSPHQMEGAKRAAVHFLSPTPRACRAHGTHCAPNPIQRMKAWKDWGTLSKSLYPTGLDPISCEIRGFGHLAPQFPASQSSRAATLCQAHLTAAHGTHRLRGDAPPSQATLTEESKSSPSDPLRTVPEPQDEFTDEI